jgi:hypothetical protein
MPDNKDNDVCGRRFCEKCQLYHDGIHGGPNPKNIGLCYRHDTAHAPLKFVTDLPEEMD